MSTHIQSIADILDPYQHHPKVIQQAVLLVHSHPSLNRFPDARRRILSILVARVPKAEACAPIENVEHAWIARMAGCCTRTVTRAIEAFKSVGLIEELGDGRDPTGAFVRRTYRLTPSLARLLELPTKCFPSRKTPVSDAVVIELKVKKDHGEIPNQKTKTPASIQLPPELDQLPEELGISRPTIAKLRGEACAAGYDLAHVVACAKRFIVAKGVQAKRIPGYLRKMIATPNADYAARAAQEGRVAAQADFEAQATTAAKKHAGKAYVAPDGLTYRFRADGSVEILDGGTIVGRLPLDQIEDIAARLEAAEAAAPAPAQPAPTASMPKAGIRAHLAGALAMLKGCTAQDFPVIIKA